MKRRPDDPTAAAAAWRISWIRRDAFRGPPPDDLCFLVVRSSCQDMLAWTGLVKCDHFFPGHIALEENIIFKVHEEII